MAAHRSRRSIAGATPVTAGSSGQPRPGRTRSAHRLAAWTALLGEDDQHAFARDLAVLGVGLPPGAQLGHAAGLMNAAPWLTVALSWPGRYLAPTGPAHGEAWYCNPG